VTTQARPNNTRRQPKAQTSFWNWFRRHVHQCPSPNFPDYGTEEWANFFRPWQRWIEREAITVEEFDEASCELAERPRWTPKTEKRPPYRPTDIALHLTEMASIVDRHRTRRRSESTEQHDDTHFVLGQRLSREQVLCRAGRLAQRLRFKAREPQERQRELWDKARRRFQSRAKLPSSPYWLECEVFRLAGYPPWEEEFRPQDIESAIALLESEAGNVPPPEPSSEETEQGTDIQGDLA